ncbi:UDP-glycosyltransferase [Dokdonia sp.]|uniref:UDP-glycosyltransferase n=1 Tax=Dokdonia sp. TaxID=2024995 RepID=UPI0032673E6B
MNVLKVLIVVESIDVDDSSGTKGRVALIKNMVRAGYDVTVLHYTQKEVLIEGVHCISIKENRFSRHFILSKIQRYIYRWFKYNIGVRQERKHGFSYTWINDSKTIAKAVESYNPDDFDMLWTFGKGTSFRMHAGVLRVPKWYSKWYAYVHDPYPQQLYPRPYNYVPEGYKKKRYFFRDMTQVAKYMVFPSVLLKEWMQSYFIDIDGKELIIPHQITEIPHTNIELPAYFTASKFTILHAGNLLDLRDPKPLVTAFKNFCALYPEAKSESNLIFIGKASIFDDYLQSEIKENSSICKSEDYVPFDQVYRMQQETTMNVILEATSEISPFLPGKFAHCVAANKPILLIGPYYSESKRLLGEAYPYTYEFKQIDELTQTMSTLYKAWKQGTIPKLDRPDLYEYLSTPYLKKSFEESLKN